MNISYQTQAFVLSKTDFGEADRFYHVFTKDFGRLELLAKGVRKMAAKLRSCLEPFGLVDLEFVQGKRYKTLTDVRKIRAFSSLKRDLKKLQLALEINHLSAKLLRGEERDEKVWPLLEETFERLDSDSDLKPKTYHLLYYYFLWQLFALLGYRPELQRCLGCQARLTPSRLYFNAQEGGVLCSSCSIPIKMKDKLSLDTLKLLRIILDRQGQLLARLNFSPQALEGLAKISKSYLIFVEDKP